ncbi:MAG: ribosome maturation factor RimM [Acetatifactor sp.]
MEDMLQVGVIASTHGVRGEVKVFPTTDDAKRFKRLKEVILDTGKERITLEIEGVKFFKQFVILKFKGIDNIDAVQKYRQKSIYVTRQNAVRLGRDEYFIADLMGLRVVDEEGQELGVLKEVMETGANDVYVIEMKDGRELLLPAIKQCVLQVSVEEGFVKVHILEGLL